MSAHLFVQARTLNLPKLRTRLLADVPPPKPTGSPKRALPLPDEERVPPPPQPIAPAASILRRRVHVVPTSRNSLPLGPLTGPRTGPRTGPLTGPCALCVATRSSFDNVCVSAQHADQRDCPLLGSAQHAAGYLSPFGPAQHAGYLPDGIIGGGGTLPLELTSFGGVQPNEWLSCVAEGLAIPDEDYPDFHVPAVPSAGAILDGVFQLPDFDDLVPAMTVADLLAEWRTGDGGGGGGGPSPPCEGVDL